MIIKNLAIVSNCKGTYTNSLLSATRYPTIVEGAWEAQHDSRGGGGKEGLDTLICT